jgi:hypothetical protein
LSATCAAFNAVSGVIIFTAYVASWPRTAPAANAAITHNARDDHFAFIFMLASF